MARRASSGWRPWCLSFAIWLGAASTVFAAALDEKGEISLGVRAYTAARVATQNTDVQICYGAGRSFRCGGSNGLPPDPTRGQTFKSLTFPVSAAGHLRQNRFYVEAELDHNLQRLLDEGFGPLALLDHLPFTFRKFKYHLTFRGEAEGIYDYGPAEYRTAYQYYNKILVPDFSGHTADIGAARRRLRNLSVHREQLFQAYLETQVEKLFVRFGRQILSWGETDAFRLLDNINPLDNSFGGFLIPLDERRVPLDMLLLNYQIGKLGPLNEMFIEAYAAIDNAIGYDPGIPEGSPWALPNLGAPSAVLATIRTQPERVVKDTRGGFRINFGAPIPGIEEAQFSIAHYYTYLDVPEVQTFVTGSFPLGFPPPPGGGPGSNKLALAVQTGPRVQITGATANFAMPYGLAQKMMLSGQPIFRTELAYFAGEARQSQAQLDPFVFSDQCRGSGKGVVVVPPGNPILPQGGTLCTGGVRYGDSWNFVLGIDLNQFVHWINPNQSLFITTQFFYKHLKGAVPRQQIPGEKPGVFNGEVLPVPAYNIQATGSQAGASQPVLIHQPVDQYLQTLLIATSYYSGQISPSLTLFYDWSGSFVAIPQITFSRDPFRFTFSYSYLTAQSLKGASGVSLYRDRDNVLFQLEYVI